MSRPVVVIVLSLVAGVIVSDCLFYQRYEIPMWLNVAAWGFCFCLALVSVALWRREFRRGAGRYVFPVLVSLFFFVVGVARYASYAKEVRASWAATARPPSNRGNPDEFDYVRWRWIQGVENDASFVGRLRRRALEVRASLVERYSSADMDAEAEAIIVASTLADRSRLTPEMRDLYAAAGASHLLALSGLHLSIIVGLFLSLLNGRLRLSRWRPLLGALVILFIWTYAFVVGLPTSLVRASMMMTLFLIGSLLGRESQSFHWLALTALLMLLLRPVCLFDVGAQLSFAAVAGILMIHHRLMRWFRDRFSRFAYQLERYHVYWVLSMLSVSVSAQVFTLPLVAYYFHQIPVYAPLLNLVLIPLTTVLIYGAILLLALSFVPFCFSIVPLLGKALSAVVAVELAVMRFAVGLPGAVVYDFWSRKAEPQVVVYNNRCCPALHIIASPSQSWLLMPVPDSAEVGMRYIASTFWKQRLTAEPQLLRDRRSIALDNGFTAVMVADNHALPAQLRADVLWLTRGFHGHDLSSLHLPTAPRLLVLDASLPYYQRYDLQLSAARVGWPLYDVAEQGGLRFRLTE